MATVSRKIVTIYDYPEHLNPFRENDNHSKLKFWTLGRKLKRSDSVSFSGIKTELKNSWAFRSFKKKSNKAPTPPPKPGTQQNGESSPVVFRRALQYSSASNTAMNGSRMTLGAPERPNHYEYKGSITPLPRSRFQERLRSPSNYEINGFTRNGMSMTPRMARSEVSGSRASMESTNPFDEHPVPPVRALRRKKNKAPLPPAAGGPTFTANVSVISSDLDTTTDPNTTNELNTTTQSDQKTVDTDLEDDLPCHVELRIVEEHDENQKELPKTVENVLDNSTIPITVQELIENQATPLEQEQPQESSVTANSTRDDLPSTKIEPEVIVPKQESFGTANSTKDDIPSIEIEPEVIVPKSIESAQEYRIPLKSENNNDNKQTKDTTSEKTIKQESKEQINGRVSFFKVDISKYRRNSSVDEDNIVNCRNKSEVMPPSPNKRSKSLSNNLNQTFTTYDFDVSEGSQDADIIHNDKPKKVICKLYDDLPRKKSLDVSISSTEREFIEIDKATRELEQEMSKLNSALKDDNIDNDVVLAKRVSVSDMRKIFDNNNFSTPNPIPKPRRNHYGSSSPINGN